MFEFIGIRSNRTFVSKFTPGGPYDWKRLAGELDWPPLFPSVLPDGQLARNREPRKRAARRWRPGARTVASTSSGRWRKPALPDAPGFPPATPVARNPEHHSQFVDAVEIAEE